MYSTASDLARFSDALFSYRLVRPESLEMILKPGLDNYGFGAWIYQMEIRGKKLKVIKRPGPVHRQPKVCRRWS